MQPSSSQFSRSGSFKRRGSIYETTIAGLYDLEQTIGRGHFAVVKLARHVFTGEKVAVKVIDKTKLDPVSTDHLFQEVRCMKLVQHPNIVRLYEVIDTQTKLFLILELGEYDLYDYLMQKQEPQRLSEHEAQRYFAQIVRAISFCHQLHVVHRDLKPENVVFFEKLGMVKLTDFGFSNLYSPGEKLDTSCGSLAYSAPEILLGDSYEAPAVDIWSLGVILYMLVCGELPFHETNDSETLTKILDCSFLLPQYLSNECKQLIRRLLVREPLARASLEEIQSHPWVRKGDLGHATHLPLVSREHVSDASHEHILEQMVSGGIATPEMVLRALERDEYSYITATYYLLAERLLRKERHAQAQRLAERHAKPESHQLQIGALALSPRVRAKAHNLHSLDEESENMETVKDDDEEEVEVQDPMSLSLPSSALSAEFGSNTPLSAPVTLDTNSSVYPPQFTFESPVLGHALVASTSTSTSINPEQQQCQSSGTSSRRGSNNGGRPRTFSILQEESEEELASYLDYPNEIGDGDSSGGGKRRSSLPSSRTHSGEWQGGNREHYSIQQPSRKKVSPTPGEELEDLPLIPESLAGMPVPSTKRTSHGHVACLDSYSDFYSIASSLVAAACSPPRNSSAAMGPLILPLSRSAGGTPLRRPGNHTTNSSSTRSTGIPRTVSASSLYELQELTRKISGTSTGSANGGLGTIVHSGSSSGRATPSLRSRSPSPSQIQGRTSPIVIKYRNLPSSRKLSAVSSSPQLLEISEEAELEGAEEMMEDPADLVAARTLVQTSLMEEGRGGGVMGPQRPGSLTTYSLARAVRRRQAVVSPDVIRRYERPTPSRSRRSTSCSSSEASDDDEKRFGIFPMSRCSGKSDNGSDNDDDEPSVGGSGSMKKGRRWTQTLVVTNENGGKSDQKSTTVDRSKSPIRYQQTLDPTKLAVRLKKLALEPIREIPPWLCLYATSGETGTRLNGIQERRRNFVTRGRTVSLELSAEDYWCRSLQKPRSCEYLPELFSASESASDSKKSSPLTQLKQQDSQANKSNRRRRRTASTSNSENTPSPLAGKNSGCMSDYVVPVPSINGSPSKGATVVGWSKNVVPAPSGTVRHFSCSLEVVKDDAQQTSISSIVPLLL